MIESPASGIRAFQLRILSGMRGNEEFVERAFHELGADHAEAQMCRAATEGIFAPSGRLENVTAILGAPMASETVNAEAATPGGSATLTKLTYRLPLWPDLVFYFLDRPGLPVMHDAGFARSPGGPLVTLSSPEELQPWGCLLEEVIASFGPPVLEGDVWAPYGEYKFQDRGSQARSFWAVFSWNLLQNVDWA